MSVTEVLKDIIPGYRIRPPTEDENAPDAPKVRDVMLCHDILDHVISCYAMSCHVMSYHVISSFMVSRHIIISCHVIISSYPVLSCPHQLWHYVNMKNPYYFHMPVISNC